MIITLLLEGKSWQASAHKLYSSPYSFAILNQHHPLLIITVRRDQKEELFE